MCLGVPGKVMSISGNVALLDVWGNPVEVTLDQLEEPVRVGDYVLEHAGIAVRVITPALVSDTLSLYEINLTEIGWCTIDLSDEALVP